MAAAPPATAEAARRRVVIGVKKSARRGDRHDDGESYDVLINCTRVAGGCAETLREHDNGTSRRDARWSHRIVNSWLRAAARGQPAASWMRGASAATASVMSRRSNGLRRKWHLQAAMSLCARSVMSPVMNSV
jgi:hypothetical protein